LGLTGHAGAGTAPSVDTDLASGCEDALQNVGTRAANFVLGTAAAQTLWEEANRRMHTQLVNVLEGNKVRNISTENGDVVLDLRPLLERVAGRLGIEDRLKANQSETTGQITILHSDQLNPRRRPSRRSRP
jgi:hypothetical protein